MSVQMYAVVETLSLNHFEPLFRDNGGGEDVGVEI